MSVVFEESTSIRVGFERPDVSLTTDLFRANPADETDVPANIQHCHSSPELLSEDPRHIRFNSEEEHSDTVHFTEVIRKPIATDGITDIGHSRGHGFEEAFHDDLRIALPDEIIRSAFGSLA